MSLILLAALTDAESSRILPVGRWQPGNRTVSGKAAFR